MSGTEAQKRGLWGEELVAADLARKGHRIVALRWCCRYGEIDIISECGNFLCFVEVKLRKNADVAPARAFVTQSKQKKLRITAELYLAQNPTNLQPRMDVVEVYAKQGKETKSPAIIYWGECLLDGEGNA